MRPLFFLPITFVAAYKPNTCHQYGSEWTPSAHAMCSCPSMICGATACVLHNWADHTMDICTHLDSQEHASEVGVDHALPLVQLHAHDQAVTSDAGIVHKDIHCAPLCNCLLE